nr:UDP-N-acetylmuramoyl-tripeptide--D-alanyl-D-alanine ligase [Desulfobulbaceae bacterium]
MSSMQNRFAGSTTIVEAGFGYGFATKENPSWTLNQILLATGGRLVSGSAHAGFRSISTDSRAIKPGDMFLALVGDNFDGTAFVGQAIKKGAAGVIVTKSIESYLPVPVVQVENTLLALGDLARYRRNLLRGIKVIALTGSSGKTTVKEMTASILEKRGNVLKTQGNFNNLVGLPLSLLPVNYRHEYVVLEMGMNRPGEIARLAEIADPDIVCINNVQAAHLEGLGSIEGVAAAKGELFESCRSSAVLVINLEDPLVRKLARKCKNEKVTFGQQLKADVRSTHFVAKGQDGVDFTLHIGNQKARVHLNAMGEHNVLNSLAAAAMAYAAGAEISEIVSGLESFTSQSNRLGIQELSGGLTVINDSYNANPASMQAALATVQGIRKGSKTVAVLGDMLELGDCSEQEHSQIGELAAWSGFDYLFAVGAYAETMVVAARSAGMSLERALKFQTKTDLATHIIELLEKDALRSGDIVLVKGSRGMHMEEVIKELECQIKVNR